MELRDYWRALRRRWWILLTCLACGVLGALAVNTLTPPTYAARAELFVAPKVDGSASELQQGSTFMLSRVKSYVEVIPTEVILEPVINDLDLDIDVAQLSRQISASVVPETVVVGITASADTPETAAQIANAVAERFAQVGPTLESGDAIVQITIVDPAREPRSPITPRVSLNLALGLLVGAACGIALAVARDVLDRRIRTESDVRLVTGAPIIGHIPADSGAKSDPLALQRRDSTRSEAIRQLRTNLQFLDIPAGQRGYVVTSSIHGEGKTVTALTLAGTLADAGQRVLLLEADLRRPTVAALTGLVGSAGLTDCLLGHAGWREVVQEWRSRIDVILAGPLPLSPPDLLASTRMELLLDELMVEYDMVIVDAPPLLPVTDAALLAKRCAGAIVVVAAGRHAVTSPGLEYSLQTLEMVGAQVLGVVLNKLPHTSSSDLRWGRTHAPDRRAHTAQSSTTTRSHTASSRAVGLTVRREHRH